LSYTITDQKSFTGMLGGGAAGKFLPP